MHRQLPKLGQPTPPARPPRWILALGLLVHATVTAVSPLEAANGTLFYNRIPTATSPAFLRRIDGDGTADQAIPINLPSALNPTPSRDGRRLLVTSPDPARPFQMSQNVFVIDFVTGTLGRATTYQDESVVDGVLFRSDLAQRLGDNRISSYKLHNPIHKAFSPEGGRVVVMNVFKSGIVFNPADVQSASGRFPIVDVFNLGNAAPAGPYVFLSPQERDGFNQGGDGVDWHPALNEVVATVASDIPAVGTGGRTSLEGTVLAVFSTASISPFIRKLTNPVGQADAFFDISTLIATTVTPHDYAPTVSPDGTRVAYVRHFLRQDTRFDGAGIAPLPSICSIRVINYNGTGDREVLRLNEGLWVSRVTWSPDGSQIAFDTAPQAVLNGWNSLLGDVTRSSISVVNADGTNPRALVAAPASYPSWAPGLSVATPTPVLSITSDGSQFTLRIDQLVPGTPFSVDGATRLAGWGSLGTFTAAGVTHFITITPDAGTPVAFYRIRL